MPHRAALPLSNGPPGGVLLGVMVRKRLPELGARKFKILQSEGEALAVECLDALMRRYGLKRGSREGVLDLIQLGEPHDHVWLAPDKPSTFEWLSVSGTAREVVVIAGCLNPHALWSRAFRNRVISEYLEPDDQQRKLREQVAADDLASTRRHMKIGRGKRGQQAGSSFVVLPSPTVRTHRLSLHPKKILARVFSALSARDREIMLRRAEGIKLHEIGKEFGIGKSTVGDVLKRFSLLWAHFERRRREELGLAIPSHIRALTEHSGAEGRLKRRRRTKNQ